MKDDIIRMAREAGWDMEWGGTTIEQVTAFAALVAAAEREACAKAVERAGLQIDGAFRVTDQPDFIATRITDFYVATIRARGDA